MHELFKKYGLKHLSISQVKTIKRSPFAWICEKVLDRRSPPSEATTFGSFVHENFEWWLADKIEKPEVIYISEEAKEFWVVAWNAKLLKFWGEYRRLYPFWPCEDGIEKKFSLSLDDQLPPFIGMIDVVSQNETHVLIQDHKTVGNKSYAPKTSADLAADPQLNLYAWAMRGEQELLPVVQHNQLFKKIKRKPVNILTAELTWESVESVVEQVRQDALQAITILEEYDRMGIEKFAHFYSEGYEQTRWDFGGCPHWNFFKECQKKYLDNKRKVSYNKGNKGEDTMPEDLHALVGKAREHFTAEGLIKFDLADAVVDAVMQNLVSKKVKAIFVRDGEGGDLIYNQLLNRIAENGIHIFKKVI